MKKLAFTLALALTALFLSGQTHFVPAFEGNGQDHMNIYVISAEIAGVPLEAGDEIAAFDGSICCAVLTLAGTVSPTSPGVLRASMPDINEANGFTSGNPITLRLWDSSAAKEYSIVTLVFYNTSQEVVSPALYTPGESAFVAASANTDITPTLTVTPNSMDGKTNFDQVIRITELNQADSEGEIRVVIPRDSRWTFSWNPALTEAGGIAVNNSAWSYNGTDVSVHIFSTTAVVPGGSSLLFGIKAVFDPGSTKGISTITTQIIPGSGSDSRASNNSDSEVVNYFGGN